MNYNDLKKHLNNPDITIVPLGPDALRMHDKISPPTYGDLSIFWSTLSKCTKRWWGHIRQEHRRQSDIDPKHTVSLRHSDAELRSRLSIAEISTVEFDWATPHELH